MTEVIAIERRHSARPEERDRDHRFAHPFCREDTPRETGHAIACKGDPDAVSRHVNRDAHADANSEVMPPVRAG